MPVTLLVKHRVADFDSWKKVFNRNAATRNAHGCLATKVLRDANAPEVVVVLVRVKDLKAAKQYIRRAELVDGMWRAGVKEAPEVLYLDEIDGDGY